jgi:hypothetical protein
LAIRKFCVNFHTLADALTRLYPVPGSRPMIAATLPNTTSTNMQATVGSYSTLFSFFADNASKHHVTDTEDLPSCGYVEPEWTLGTGRTRYVTECYLAPYMKGTPIKFYKYNINLDLTCVAPNVNESLSTALGKT